jgi:hypothetical protein
LAFSKNVTLEIPFLDAISDCGTKI